MATSMTYWIDEVLPHIPNAPAPAIYKAARKAAITFCEKTHLWAYTLDLIDVVADTEAYTLTIPTALYAELIGVPKDGVRYKEDGEDEEAFATLDLTSEEELDAESGSWRYETAPSPDRWYMDNVDKQIHLVSTPEDASTDGLEVKVILKPNKTCTTLPDFLYNDHMDVITAGALYYLFISAGSPWFNADLAKTHYIDFRNGYNDAKLKKFTGPTNKPMNIKMRYFA